MTACSVGELAISIEEQKIAKGVGASNQVFATQRKQCRRADRPAIRSGIRAARPRRGGGMPEPPRAAPAGGWPAPAPRPPVGRARRSAGSRPRRRPDRRPPGGPRCSRWTRIWWVRPVCSSSRSRSATPKRPTTKASVRAARPVGRDRSSASGPAGAGRSAPRSRSGSRRGGPRPAPRRCAGPGARRSPSPSRRWARSVLATTMSPEVSRSSRCTMPGRPSAPPDRVVPRATSAFTSVSSQWPGAGCTTRPAGLSITARCSSSKTTVSGMAAGWRVRGGSWSGIRTVTRSPRARSREARAVLPSTSTAFCGDQAGGLRAGEAKLVGEEPVEALGRLGGDREAQLRQPRRTPVRGGGHLPARGRSRGRWRRSSRRCRRR